MGIIEIKKALLTDLEALQQIGRQTFLETFSESNTEENMLKYLDEGFSRQQLYAELNNPASLFYFAILDTAVIGYLKLNTGSSQTELQDSRGIEIERIYVLQAYQGKKIGQLLYETAIQVSKESRAEYVWLGVWEKNPKAIGFYRKHGFVEFDQHVFKLGDDEQTDIMMKKKL